MKKEVTPTGSESSQQVASETNKLNSSNMLLEKHKIENTPFEAIKWKDDKGEQWILTMGPYRLSPSLPDREAVTLYATEASWDLIMAVMNAMIMDNEHRKKLNETLERQRAEMTRYNTDQKIQEQINN